MSADVIGDIVWGFYILLAMFAVFLACKGPKGGSGTTIITSSTTGVPYDDISPRVDIAGQVQQGMEMAMESFETSRAIAEGFKAPFDALGAVYN